MSGRAREAANDSLTLVVPLFDESDRFRVHIEQLLSFIAAQPSGSELLFVDDGSRDGTPDLVEKTLAAYGNNRARLMRRPHRGKGAAVHAGLEVAQGAVGAFCDLDLSTPIPSLVEIIGAARRAPIIAVGSRDLSGSRLVRRESASREFLGRTYNRVVQLVLTPGVLDTQCGAKAASSEVWRRILPACHEEGFAWDVEVIAVALRLGIGVQELAIEWRHDDGSRLRMARDGAAMVAAIPRIRRSIGRVQPGDRRSDSTQWWIRSTAAYLSSILRPLATSEGWLVMIGNRSTPVAGRVGWPLERTVAIGSSSTCSTSRALTAVQTVVGDRARIPVATGAARVVCLLEVLEGGRDGPVLAEAARVIGPDGRLIVTVTAGPRVTPPASLLRRRRALRRHLADHGFEVLWASHMFSWLIPAAVAGRISSWVQPDGAELPPMGAVGDRLALVLAHLERSIMRHLSLPLGTSIVCVAARP